MSDGETVPSGGPDLEEYTIRAVTGRICGDHASFWSNVEQSLFDSPEHLDQRDNRRGEIVARSDFWHSIAFTNLIPRIMASQSDKPKPEDHKPGTRRLASLIMALEPDLVCLFSHMEFSKARPWGEAPEYDGFASEPENVAGVEFLTRYKRPNGGVTLIAGFKHASRAGYTEARDRFHSLRDQISALKTG